MTESAMVEDAPDVSDLLREGEALSRGRNYGEALIVSTGPSPCIHPTQWRGTTVVFCSKVSAMQREQSNPSPSV